MPWMERRHAARPSHVAAPPGTRSVGSASIAEVSYQRAFERIRGEFLEMPGMRLTAAQVGRLCGIGMSACRLVLDDLVRAHVVSRGPGDTYARDVRDE